jgi:uncharacterized GH25 family protein
MTGKYLSVAVLAGLISFPFLPASAHDVFLVPAQDGYFVVSGHGDKWSSFKPENVEQVTGYDAAGKAFNIVPHKRDLTFNELPGMKLDNPGVFLDVSGAGMVTVLFKDGYWAETSDGWAALPKKHFKEGYDSVAYYASYNKTLIKWEAAYSKPTGADVYELVPLASPWSKTETLPVQVFHRGKPVPGAAVEVDGDPTEYRTDGQGKVVLPLRQEGVHLIYAKHEEVLQDDPHADARITYAYLAFAR